jgi:hypothetical protein
MYIYSTHKITYQLCSFREDCEKNVWLPNYVQLYSSKKKKKCPALVQEKIVETSTQPFLILCIQSMVKYIGPSLAIFPICTDHCLHICFISSELTSDASLLMVNASPILPYHLDFLNNLSASIHIRFSQTFVDIYL